jgi:hypothetical protein
MLVWKWDTLCPKSAENTLVYAHHITTQKDATAPDALHILKKGHSCSVPKAPVPEQSKKQNACVQSVKFMVSSGLKASISVCRTGCKQKGERKF